MPGLDDDVFEDLAVIAYPRWGWDLAFTHSFAYNVNGECV